VEILAALDDFFDYKEQDILILSKGHASLALYALLSERFTNQFRYGTASKTLGHPVKNRQMGIEFSTGSLGIGLASGVGFAISQRLKSSPTVTTVVIGDGECNEGIVYESARIAASHLLSNLLVVIDRNMFQQTGSTSDISGEIDLFGVWRSLNWNVHECDGHNSDELKFCLNRARKVSKENHLPSVIVANTIKGKGVSEFESTNVSHHVSLSPAKYQELMSSLSENES